MYVHFYYLQLLKKYNKAAYLKTFLFFLLEFFFSDICYYFFPNVKCLIINYLKKEKINVVIFNVFTFGNNFIKAF